MLMKKLSFEEFVGYILDNKDSIFISKKPSNRKEKIIIMDYLVNFPVKNNKLLFLGIDGDNKESIIKIEKAPNLSFYEYPESGSITVTTGTTSTWNLYYLYVSKTNNVYI